MLLVLTLKLTVTTIYILQPKIPNTYEIKTDFNKRKISVTYFFKYCIDNVIHEITNVIEK